ncbi:MAG: hypothetical protein R3302_03115 [Sulfurimonadaceae bacterium]|nr:hypothetical protein [Sulfurimonadaceae bacterium]
MTISSDKKLLLGGILAAWIGFEFLVLNGETVADQHHRLGVPFAFEVNDTGDDYRVTIGREEGGTGGVKRVLAYKLVGPSGDIVHSDSEEWPRLRRSFNFTSYETGSYVLHVKGALQPYTSNNSTWVQVEKNDNTLLLRLLGL